MEVAAGRLGATFVHLQPGQSTWQMEFEEGVVMNGAAQEHVREAAPVLSAYADVLAVRAFPKDHTRDERVIRAFANHASAPLINLESALAHPCQGLADLMTMQDLASDSLKGKKICLTWAPHPRPLPQAVPLSVVRAAILGGAELHIANPAGFELDAEELERAASLCEGTGAQVIVTPDQAAACEGALAVYAKGWSAGDRSSHAERSDLHSHWTVGASQMKTADAFLHCLPVRRNVIVTDEILDGPKSRVVAQAANREHVQAALLLAWLL
jgi:N-acetylornithine carbamoyltransferase